MHFARIYSIEADDMILFDIMEMENDGVVMKVVLIKYVV